MEIGMGDVFREDFWIPAPGDGRVEAEASKGEKLNYRGSSTEASAGAPRRALELELTLRVALRGELEGKPPGSGGGPASGMEAAPEAGLALGRAVSSALGRAEGHFPAAQSVWMGEPGHHPLASPGGGHSLLSCFISSHSSCYPLLSSLFFFPLPCRNYPRGFQNFKGRPIRRASASLQSAKPP